MNSEPSHHAPGTRSRTFAALAGMAGLAASAVFNEAAARSAERRNPPTGRFLHVENVRLHVLDTGGSGPAVVLLHGNGATSADMETSGLIDRLRSAHRVLAFDRPGYGHSTRPRGKSWTPEAQADLIAAALNQLGVQQVVAVGHSWGALVAAALALRHPRRVAQLVLVSGYFFPTTRADMVLTSPYAVPVVGDLMRETVGPLIARALSSHIVQKMFAPSRVPERFWRQFPLELTYRPSQLRASQEETVMMAPAARRLSAIYSVITCPTTIVVGRDDAIADPGRQSIALHRVIRQSRLEVLPGVGHMAHYAAPAVVASAAEVTGTAGRTARMDVPQPAPILGN